MSFFANDAINRVYVHSGIRALAQGAGGIFVLVFLLKAGLPVPLVLLAQAAIVAGRFAIRPLLLPAAKRFGVKAMLLCGTVALAAQYLVLPYVEGLDTQLLLFCVVTSVAEVIYWMFLNTAFSTLGDVEHRGHQTSAREALVAVTGIAGPLIGGWALLTLGPKAAFVLVAGIQVAAAIPLSGLPEIPVVERADGAFRAAVPGILFSATDGWFDTFFIILWQIALFITLGESFAKYGGAMALAALAGAVCGVFLGRHIDAGHGRRSVLLAYGVLLIVALLRAPSLGTPGLAFVGNASGSIAMILISPVIGVISNLAKASPCPLRFHMGTEAGWDTGCFAACTLASALLWAGVPLAFVVLLALPGGAGGAAILWRLYPPMRKEEGNAQWQMVGERDV